VIKLNVVLQLSGLAIDFLGAVILTVVEIQSRKEIEEESSTKAGYNPELRKALMMKSNLAIFSTVILL
jgi:hypothetical protein